MSRFPITEAALEAPGRPSANLLLACRSLEQKLAAEKDISRSWENTARDVGRQRDRLAAQLAALKPAPATTAAVGTEG